MDWRSYARCCTRRAPGARGRGANDVRSAISTNVRTAAKRIPEPGATRRPSHVVAVTRATTLDSGCFNPIKRGHNSLRDSAASYEAQYTPETLKDQGKMQ